jgi:hypothetical protein
MAPEQLAGGRIDARAPTSTAFCVALHVAFGGVLPAEPEAPRPDMPRFLRPLRRPRPSPTARGPPPVDGGAARPHCTRRPARSPTRRVLLSPAPSSPPSVRRRGCSPRRSSADATALHRRLTYEPPESFIQDNALSPNGKLLAIAGTRGLQYLSLEDGKRQQLALPGKPVPGRLAGPILGG